MTQSFSLLRKYVIKTKRFFDHKDQNRSKFGLGYFVLLLTLTPFIFSLSLYNVGGSESIASKYQIDPNRFSGLSYEELKTDKFTKPDIPKVKLSKSEKNKIVKIFKTTPENFCLRRISLQSNSFTYRLIYQPFYLQHKKECLQYERQLATYKKDKKNYDLEIESLKKNKKEIRALAASFIKTKHPKPKPPAPEVIETSQNNFNYLLSQASKTSTIETHETTPEHNEQSSLDKPVPFYITLKERTLNASSLQIIHYPSWYIGLLLLIPTLLVCIKRKAWGLLAFGLIVPAYNYLIYFSTLFSGSSFLTFFQLSSPLFAQIALLYFLLQGSIRSKAYIVFISLLILSTFLPLAFNSITFIDSSYSGHESYSVFNAQLPIIIFILVTCIVRLMIKGAKENISLLKNSSLLTNLSYFSRSLILWIPLFILCLPFFYITESLIPKHTINKLNNINALQYDYEYEYGFLDNALQSAAHITDDINFIWHLTIEERIAYIQLKNKTLQAISFSETVSKHFDELIPNELAFKKSNSDIFLAGWLVDAVADEVQQSINDSFKDMRKSIKNSILKLANQKEIEIKNLGEDKKNEATDMLQALKIDGQNKIQSNNDSMQSAIWISVNYFQAVHQLALLFFGFICIKSFLYVFARVSFHQHTGSTITLGDPDSGDSTSQEAEELSSSGIKSKGFEYIIDSNEEQTYYVSRLYQCRGKPPKLTIPQPLSSPIARLFNKSYTMNEISLTKADSSVNCSATKGIEFFEWTLGDNEKVIFDHHNFVAMTKSITLSTLISPRISSLLLGGLLYSQATGPGKLILMTKGRAEIAGTTQQKGSLPPERIVAMLLDTKLHVDSELDFLNVYLSSAYVNPVTGKMIIDVDSQHGTKTGLASFIRNFIFPG